jgi:Family of unknown function (DUF5908)
MPVEIRELVIRATVADKNAGSTSSPALTDDAKKLQKILDEVVSKLKSRNER